MLLCILTKFNSLNEYDYDDDDDDDDDMFSFWIPGWPSYF